MTTESLPETLRAAATTLDALHATNTTELAQTLRQLADDLEQAEITTTAQVWNRCVRAT